MRFTKMQGAGNDYVYLDAFASPVEGDLPELARRMSDRRFGVGADGLIILRPSAFADARMQMFNADGAEAEMCGNGIRCVAKYLYDHGIRPSEELRIETGAGVLTVRLTVEAGVATAARVDMGRPRLDATDIPTTLGPGRVIDAPLTVGGRELRVTCVSMGNPHCVAFVPELTDELVLGLGPKIENDRRFPSRTNVEFVVVLSPGEVRQRTWERGSGETWACGTGASAVAVAGVLTGATDRRIVNHLRGGDLVIEWDEATDHVFMTGPAEEVFHGEWPCRDGDRHGSGPQDSPNIG